MDLAILGGVILGIIAGVILSSWWVYMVTDFKNYCKVRNGALAQGQARALDKLDGVVNGLSFLDAMQRELIVFKVEKALKAPHHAA